MGSVCFIKSHTAFSVVLGEVKDEAASFIRLLRSMNLKLLVVTGIGGLEIKK